MNMHAAPVAAKGDALPWLKILARYREPDRRRSTVELAVTLVAFLVLWGTALASANAGVWWGLVLILPAAGFLLRLFMLQHDCGHGALFAKRHVDDWVGRALGVLTLTPYDYWKGDHAAHHASAGNLDERGFGDIDTLTVAEYQARSRWGRLQYRLYRNPIVMFVIGPVYLFMLKHRWPFETFRVSRMPWISVMWTNLAIAVFCAAVMWFVGVVPFLLVHLPVVALAGAAGIWLFYVQHQFEETHWSSGDEWEFQESALHGSSHYVMPWPLPWLTGNIGIHHVHHLSSRVPFYRLPEVLRDYPQLANIGRITIPQSLKLVKLALWDENAKRLISFREARALPAV